MYTNVYMYACKHTYNTLRHIHTIHTLSRIEQGRNWGKDGRRENINNETSSPKSAKPGDILRDHNLLGHCCKILF